MHQGDGYQCFSGKLATWFFWPYQQSSLSNHHLLCLPSTQFVTNCISDTFLGGTEQKIFPGALTLKLSEWVTWRKQHFNVFFEKKSDYISEWRGSKEFQEKGEIYRRRTFEVGERPIARVCQNPWGKMRAFLHLHACSSNCSKSLWKNHL